MQPSLFDSTSGVCCVRPAPKTICRQKSRRCTPRYSTKSKRNKRHNSTNQSVSNCSLERQHQHRSTFQSTSESITEIDTHARAHSAHAHKHIFSVERGTDPKEDVQSVDDIQQTETDSISSQEQIKTNMSSPRQSIQSRKSRASSSNRRHSTDPSRRSYEYDYDDSYASRRRRRNEGVPSVCPQCGCILKQMNTNAQPVYIFIQTPKQSKTCMCCPKQQKEKESRKTCCGCKERLGYSEEETKCCCKKPKEKTNRKEKRECECKKQEPTTCYCCCKDEDDEDDEEEEDEQASCCCCSQDEVSDEDDSCCCDTEVIRCYLKKDKKMGKLILIPCESIQTEHKANLCECDQHKTDKGKMRIHY